MEAKVCTCCKGAKVVQLTTAIWGSDKPSSIDEMSCLWCRGTGVMTTEQAGEHRFAQGCWCECACDVCGDERECDCDDRKRAAPVYHKDGKTPWEWCVRKHHWHCGSCRKLTQIG